MWLRVYRCICVYIWCVCDDTHVCGICGDDTQARVIGCFNGTFLESGNWKRKFFYYVYETLYPK